MNGRHRKPDINETVFKANLFFTPGALLKNEMKSTSTIEFYGVSIEIMFNLLSKNADRNTSVLEDTL